MMKEAVVVLSLLFAVLSTGFGELGVPNDPTQITSDPTTAETSTSTGTSAKSTHSVTTEISSTSATHHGVTTQAVTTESVTTHSVTTSPTNSTTVPPKHTDVYAVYDPDNGTYCIMIKANFSITVNYINTSSNKPVSGVVPVPVPNSVHVNGSCNDGGKQQWITISFKKDWKLTLRFEMLNNNNKYFQSYISLDFNLATSDLKNAPNDSGQISNNTHLFETSTGYLCMARKTLYQNSSTTNDVAGIYTEKLQLEAFKHSHDSKLSDKYERCSEDNISNLVPIIVGACLGGLIIIVLIAYLIGRKRSRRGYESV